MTSTQVVEMLVNVTSKSPSQDDAHSNDTIYVQFTVYDMTPGFKPSNGYYRICKPVEKYLILGSIIPQNFLSPYWHESGTTVHCTHWVFSEIAQFWGL